MVQYTEPRPASRESTMPPPQAADGERELFQQLHGVVEALELLRKRMGPTEQARFALDGVLDKARRAAKVARPLARLRDNTEPSRLHDLLIRAAELARERAPWQVDMALQPSLPEVSGDLDIIQRTVTHIIERAAGAGGHVEVSAWRLDAGAEQAKIAGSAVVVRVEVVALDGRRVDPSLAKMEELRIGMASDGAGAASALLIGYTEAEVGHRFELYLPTVETREASVGDEPSGKRVLVVECDTALARQLLAMLGGVGTQVEFASGGTEGLGIYEQARLAGRPYDLVILDPLSCEDRNEFAGFARILRHDHGVRVAVCANDDGGDDISGCSCRFDARLARPFQSADIRQLLA